MVLRSDWIPRLCGRSIDTLVGELRQVSLAEPARWALASLARGTASLAGVVSGMVAGALWGAGANGAAVGAGSAGAPLSAAEGVELAAMAEEASEELWGLEEAAEEGVAGAWGTKTGPGEAGGPGKGANGDMGREESKGYESDESSGAEGGRGGPGEGGGAADPTATQRSFDAHSAESGSSDSEGGPRRVRSKQLVSLVASPADQCWPSHSPLNHHPLGRPHLFADSPLSCAAPPRRVPLPQLPAGRIFRILDEDEGHDTLGARGNVEMLVKLMTGSWQFLLWPAAAAGGGAGAAGGASAGPGAAASAAQASGPSSVPAMPSAVAEAVGRAGAPLFAAAAAGAGAAAAAGPDAGGELARRLVAGRNAAAAEGAQAHHSHSPRPGRVVAGPAVGSPATSRGIPGAPGRVAMRSRECPGCCGVPPDSGRTCGCAVEMKPLGGSPGSAAGFGQSPSRAASPWGSPLGKHLPGRAAAHGGVQARGRRGSEGDAGGGGDEGGGGYESGSEGDVEEGSRRGSDGAANAKALMGRRGPPLKRNIVVAKPGAEGEWKTRAGSSSCRGTCSVRPWDPSVFSLAQCSLSPRPAATVECCCLPQ